MCTEEIDRVYISVPVSADAGRVYGFQEKGGDTMPTLMFQRPISLVKMAMFSQSKNETEIDRTIIYRGRKGLSRKKSKKSMIWGLQGNKEVIVGFDSMNGATEPTIRNVSELVGNRVFITSEVMVVGNSTNSSKDSLIFGMKRQTPIPSQVYSDLCDKHGVENNATNFLVQLSSAGIAWMVSTPYDFEIRGQIAGVRNTFYSQGSNNFGRPKDLMAAVAGNATRSAIFAVW
ncbi:hypothetical protein FSP39_005303 [Pinctada imbricata]|uniref:Uncharacterized protein n=1 Tax=Pinctada imbricata TaxID=66713 RepID=A0AA89BT29_PINIB|nr:hypothetical protein FSP39_005303 [Pinctada imbricata]